MDVDGLLPRSSWGRGTKRAAGMVEQQERERERKESVLLYNIVHQGDGGSKVSYMTSEVADPQENKGQIPQKAIVKIQITSSGFTTELKKKQNTRKQQCFFF